MLGLCAHFVAICVGTILIGIPSRVSRGSEFRAAAPYLAFFLFFGLVTVGLLLIDRPKAAPFSARTALHRDGINVWIFAAVFFLATGAALFELCSLGTSIQIARGLSILTCILWLLAFTELAIQIAKTLGWQGLARWWCTAAYGLILSVIASLMPSLLIARYGTIDGRLNLLLICVFFLPPLSWIVCLVMLIARVAAQRAASRHSASA
jgi:hypothetical protein